MQLPRPNPARPGRGFRTPAPAGGTLPRTAAPQAASSLRSRPAIQRSLLARLGWAVVLILGSPGLFSSPASAASAGAASAVPASTQGNDAASLESLANATNHWAFRPVADPPVPRVRNERWARTDLDRFVLARLERDGRSPSPTASRRAWIRRATFDLTGLPPEPADIDAFLADTGPDAYETVTERLLASPHYGERWGRHWLDIARYADTAGDTADYPVPEAWRYRNYVIDAFNADLPYDEFLREQIAGDILARREPGRRYAERIAATGFIALSRRFGFDSENYHHLTLQDTLDTLGQGVLGLSLGCARCHHHKSDPVTMSDYYALYGIFESTRFAFPGSEQKQKFRALSPLEPPESSQARWRDFAAEFAALGVRPAGILRSLDDIDGDFELQRFAAGGSKGVLVAPWRWQGPVEIATAAQSPFTLRHAPGTVGVRVHAVTEPAADRPAPAEAADWFVEQRWPGATAGPGSAARADEGPRGSWWFGLDFRFAATNAIGRPVRLELSDATGGARIELILTPAHAGWPARRGDATPGIQTVPVSLPAPGQWHHLQLGIDFATRTVSGSLGTAAARTALPSRALPSSWRGSLGRVRLGVEPAAAPPAPAAVAATAGSGNGWDRFDFDNVIWEPGPGPAVDKAPGTMANSGPGADPRAATAAAQAARLARLQKELDALTGIDGGFELQREGAGPDRPWHPGPNSTARVIPGAQSPFTNLHPAGRLGLRLDGGTAYQGFGQGLRPITAGARGATPLHVAFEFRCEPAPSTAAGTGATDAAGTWRFHVGHSHVLPAVELGFSHRTFHRRDGERRDPVAELEPGEWYQVQLDLDLAARTYTGVLAGRGRRTSFNGVFPAAWDGTIDYTFIDSGGHVTGVRPTLDVDNFAVGDTPFHPAPAGGGSSVVARVAALQQEVQGLTKELEAARRTLQARLDAGPMELAYGVAEGTPADARLQRRGDPDQPGEVIPRGFIRALGGGPLPPETGGSGRLELADWLTRADHPLTARVLVNRVWQHHFGRGLVATPNDFGARGRPPEDPALLDHLAAAFIRDGWSIKALHRRILASNVYRQAAAGPDDKPDDAAVPGAFPRRRLSAEEIRDAILAVSGALDREPGRGHPFPSPTTWAFTQHTPFSAVYDHDKRSVYLMTQRLKRHPFLALFDGPDPNASTAERRPTTVPTQALYFLNDPFVHAKSVRFAQRLMAAGSDPRRRVDLAHQLALGRPATHDEIEAALTFVAAYQGETGQEESGTAERNTAGRAKPPLAAGHDAWAAYGRVLFGSNEFLCID